MQKDKLVLVTDPEIIAAIERNGFGDPVPAYKTAEGYWCYQWSLEQFRLWCMNSELRDEKATERNENASTYPSQH